MEASTLKLLAIDDTPDNLTSLRAVVNDALPGCVLLTASDDHTGIELARTEDPDVILLDIVTTGLDGFEVCRSLKGDGRLLDIPVVFLTAAGTERGNRIQALEMGAEGFLSKPLDEQELVAQIRAMARIKQANRVGRLERQELAALVADRTRALELELAARAQADEALKRLAARHEAILAEIPDIVMEVDAEKVYTWANRVGLGFFGDDVIGHDAAHYFVGEQDTYEQVQPLFAGDKATFYVESWQRRKDGQNRLLAWWCRALVDSDGRVTGALSTARDITVHRRAEEEIRTLLLAVQNEKTTLAALIGSITDEVWFADAAGRFTLANPSALSAFDLAPASAVNVAELAQRLEVLRPDGSPRPLEEAPPLRALAGEVVRDQEEIVRTPATGQLRHRLVNAAPVRDSTGAIIGSVSIVSDITERKRTERALRQSAEEYRELFEAESDAIFLIDNESGRLLQANQAACALYGYSREELLTMRNVDLSAEPEHTQKVTSGTPPVASRVVTIPLRWHRKKDGTVLPVEITGRFFMRDGRAVHIAAIRDITERKRAEAALLREQELLNHLMTSLPDHIYFKDRASRFTRLNAAQARWFGLRDPSDAVGKTDSDYFSPEHAQQAYADEQRVMVTGEAVVGLEEKETWPDGRVTWVSTTKVPIRDAAGQVVGLLGVSRDVTGRKQAEDALRKSEEELRAILDATPFPVALVDVQDKEIAYWSRSADTQFGHTAPTAAEWYQIAYPDPEYRREVIARWKLALEEARLSGRAVNAGEYRVTCRDGSERLCELHARFLAERLVVTFNDITARTRAEEAWRASEERYGRILHAAMDGFWSVDLQGHLLEVNEAYCRMSGYTARELLTMSVSDVECVETPDDTAAHIQELVLRGDGRFESRHRRKDGSVFDVEIGAQYRPDLGARVVAFIRDITEHKQAEARIGDQLEELCRWHQATVGREGRILDLKKEVNDLLAKAGEPPRYPSALEHE